MKKRLVLVALLLVPALASAQQRFDGDGNPFYSKFSSGLFYAIKRDNITTSSVNLSFGFKARKIVVETKADNSAELCVDWIGGTAACPSANTAGDDRIAPGGTVILDDFYADSISVIAASGTLTVYVRAFR